MYDVKAGEALPITDIGKAVLVTSWGKKKSVSLRCTGLAKM